MGYMRVSANQSMTNILFEFKTHANGCLQPSTNSESKLKNTSFQSVLSIKVCCMINNKMFSPFMSHWLAMGEEFFTMILNNTDDLK